MNINAETLKHLKIMFADAAELGKYDYNEFDLFLHDIIMHGTIIMEKIILGQVEEDDLADIDDVIILNKENMFSEN